MQIIERIHLAIALLFALSRTVFTQATPTGVPFLQIPAPVEGHALGQISSLLVTDPLAVRDNPSITPLLTFSGLVHGALYTPATDWLPGFQVPITFESQGGVVGYRLSGEGWNGWVLGFGVNRVKLDLGDFAITMNGPEPIATYHAWETSWSQTIGLAYAGPVIVSAGFALTQVRSHLPNSSLPNPSDAEARANTWSWGITVLVPVIRLIGIDEPEEGIRPFADVISTLSVTDLGKDIHYGVAFQNDPLPRAATMGFSASGGLRTRIMGRDVNVIRLEWLREASDVLVSRTGIAGTWHYQSGLGDLRPIDDLFVQRGNTLVVHRKGVRAELAEMVTFAQGSFVDSGFDLILTSGYAFSTRGPFLLLRSLLDGGGSFGWILEHLAIRYAVSSYSAPYAHPLGGTEFQSITFSIH